MGHFSIFDDFQFFAQKCPKRQKMHLGVLDFPKSAQNESFLKMPFSWLKASEASFELCSKAFSPVQLAGKKPNFPSVCPSLPSKIFYDNLALKRYKQSIIEITLAKKIIFF